MKNKEKCDINFESRKLALEIGRDSQVVEDLKGQILLLEDKERQLTKKKNNMASGKKKTFVTAFIFCIFMVLFFFNHIAIVKGFSGILDFLSFVCFYVPGISLIMKFQNDNFLDTEAELQEVLMNLSYKKGNLKTLEEKINLFSDYLSNLKQDGPFDFQVQEKTASQPLSDEMVYDEGSKKLTLKNSYFKENK